MSDYNFHTEPVMSGDLKNRCSDRTKDKVNTDSYDEKWVVPEHIRRWAGSLRKTLEAFNPKTNTFKQPTVMKNETITIEAPEGHVIDKENSTDTVIRFKKVESNKRPMSFLEIKNIKGFYVDDMSGIRAVDCLNRDSTKNTWPTNKLADAALALSQLLQLRDAWNGMTQDDFVFDGTHRYFSICNRHDKVFCQEIENMRKPLSFKDEETRDAFLKQFRPLIETALPLL